MKILVTGAAGFIGSHLFDTLLKQGHEVLGVDDYSIGKYEHGLIVNLDLKDKEATAKLIEDFKPDIIHHLAAWAHEGLSQFCPIRITENNYNAYINVLVPAIKYGSKRIVVYSSMSVYGSATPPFNEALQRTPDDIYAVAKTSMERATELLSQVHGFDYQIIRPHNVYGERQALYDPYRNVVGIFINRCLANKPFYIYGDGTQTRAFSYIDDVIPALIKAGEIKTVNQIFNVGPLEEYSINELATEILKHFPNNPKPIYVADRPLEVKHAFCTNDKAMKYLDYKTQTDFKTGIANMIAWAKTQGHQKPQYLDELELETKDTPITWTRQLI